MPLRKQQSANSADTQYVPPPNANLDPNDRRRAAPTPQPKIRSAPMGPSKSAGAQAADIAQNVMGGLRAWGERIAQDRAVRADQRAQERAQRETQQAQERAEHERRQAARPVERVQRDQIQPASAHDQSEYLDEPIVIGDLSWQQLFYVYSLVLTLFAVVWLLDGVFTVLGLLQAGMPGTVIGFVLSIGLHLLASWGQRSLIFDSWWVLKLLGLGLFTMNVTANVIGIRLALAVLASPLAGTLPINPWQWITPLAKNAGSAIIGNEASLPDWWPSALIIVLLAGGLAWFSEPLLSGVHRRWRIICRQRRRR